MNLWTDFTFLNVLDDSLDYYMDHQNAGKCLIFDHEHFDDPDKKQRHGTKEDVKRIETFFEKRLGFEVMPFHDLSKIQLIETTQTSIQSFFEFNNNLLFVHAHCSS